VWRLEVAHAPLYGATFVALRRAGRLLSPVDIMLAVLARDMRLTLLTADRDFEALPDIPTENWLP
jgi:predicted nucleic acid-binding protein